MLSPDIDMEREIEDVDSMLTRELEQIDSKTVEDLFKGVICSDQPPGTSPASGKSTSDYEIGLG